MNGWEDSDALFRHYSGEGNVRHHVVTAYSLQEKLHYKSKRSLSFNTFLDKMQKMFTIFRDEGKQMSDITQVRKLFRRVQHPQLQDTVKALEVRSDLDDIKYLEAYNHLTAAVSNMPHYQFSLNVSVIQCSLGNSGGNSGGCSPRKGG